MQIRTLHIIYALTTGGIELWLLSLARLSRQSNVSMDFAVYSKGSDSLEATALQYGCEIFHLGRNPLLSLAGVLLAKKYDVVHLHTTPASNPLIVASDLGVPIRAVHAHSCLQKAREAYLGWVLQDRERMIPSITHRLAVSRKAGATMFGLQIPLFENFRVMPVGVELDLDQEDPYGNEVRDSLGIPQNCLVLGHVGRLVEVKNHQYLLSIARELRHIQKDFRLLLLGDGPERSSIARNIVQYGLSDFVIAPGEVKEVHKWLRAMNVFVLPSKSEGLCRALLEAEAEGIPCVISRSVPKEVDVIPQLIFRLSIDEPPINWSKTIVSASSQRMNRDKALKLFIGSRYTVTHSGNVLFSFYESALNSRGSKFLAREACGGWST